MTAKERRAIITLAKSASTQMGLSWYLFETFARAYLPGDIDSGKALHRGAVTVHYNAYQHAYTITFGLSVAIDPLLSLAALHGVVLFEEKRKGNAKN